VLRTVDTPMSAERSRQRRRQRPHEERMDTRSPHAADLLPPAEPTLREIVGCSAAQARPLDVVSIRTAFDEFGRAATG
jgi:hypothetical protein